MIRLHMQPAARPMSRDDFCKSASPFSIALDGYVHGGPWFDPKGPRANFNHHEGVDRLATRATCAQVHLAIRQGFFTRFREDGEATAHVHANDCDQDVCLSWYLLKNHHRAEPCMNGGLNRLVAIEDMLDATAGAYPYPFDMPLLSEVAWVFEPYTRIRMIGGLDTRDPSVFTGVVEDVSGRIDRHLFGMGDRLKLDPRYERLAIDCGPGVVMVREHGAQARTAMFSDGIRAFVSVRERKTGGWVYVLGRMSQYVPFDIPKTIAFLNAAEKNAIVSHPMAESEKPFDPWGGGDIIGGSPRAEGSRLSPEEVATLIRGTHYEEA